MNLEKPTFSKQEIFNYLKGFDPKTIRQTINNTITEKRNVSIDYAKKQKTLRKSEVLIILSEFE